MKKIVKGIRKYLKEGPWRGGGVLFYRRRPDGTLTILLFKRKHRPGKGRFSIPGGKFDRRYDRRLEDTGLRELWEETSYRLEPTDIRGNINLCWPGYRWRTVKVEFRGQLSDFDLWGAQDRELSEVVEVTLTEAWRLPLTFPMRYTLVKSKIIGFLR
ncbi:MAG: NUDIX hydrolase [Chitinophagaceae bacterium]|jgi:8-oxo-dGTP pyrophosphatase MutT (NUDIX family)